MKYEIRWDFTTATYGERLRARVGSKKAVRLYIRKILAKCSDAHIEVFRVLSRDEWLAVPLVPDKHGRPTID